MWTAVTSVRRLALRRAPARVGTNNRHLTQKAAAPPPPPPVLQVTQPAAASLLYELLCCQRPSASGPGGPQGPAASPGRGPASGGAHGPAASDTLQVGWGCGRGAFCSTRRV